jgi:hypothetical protein
MLACIAAAILGMLFGQFTLGIPLYIALLRCEKSHEPGDFDSDQFAVDAWLMGFRVEWVAAWVDVPPRSWWPPRIWPPTRPATTVCDPGV